MLKIIKMGRSGCQAPKTNLLRVYSARQVANGEAEQKSLSPEASLNGLFLKIKQLPWKQGLFRAVVYDEFYKFSWLYRRFRVPVLEC